VRYSARTPTLQAMVLREMRRMINEEGLPIIDINEPETSISEAAPATTASFDDPYILPQWTLSPDEKACRKAETGRILDLLEEEERLEAEREERSERERFSEDLERRKQAAKSEMEDLKKAKELQKKMGRALVRNVVESKEQKEKESAQELKDAEAARAAEDTRKPLKSKKSVTFAADVSGQDVEAAGVTGHPGEWGDVISARLNRGKPTLWSNSQPMKMDVVERRAGALRSPPPPPSAPEPDSDDESNPDIDFLAEDEDHEEVDTQGAFEESDSDGHDSNGFLDDEKNQSQIGMTNNSILHVTNAKWLWRTMRNERLWARKWPVQ